MIELYELQYHAGRLFLHEHPRFASSWNLPRMTALRSLPGLYEVGNEQCAFGLLTWKDDHTMVPAEKKTGWLTNSEFIADRLNVRCPNLDPTKPWLHHSHEHNTKAC